VTGRRHLLNGIRVTAALALAVAVLTSPIRPSKASSGANLPNYLHSNFGIPHSPSKHLPTSSAASRVIQVKAIPSKQEQKQRSRPGDRLLVPAVADFVAMEPADALRTPAPAAHPLRC
jgi:hypothetical protein